MEQQPPASPLLTASPPQRNVSHAQVSPHPPRKKRRWIWIILLAIFAAAFVLVLRHKPVVSAEGGGGGRGGRQQGPVTINVATVGSGQMAVKLDAIGTVTPTYTATINSQVSGQVVSVHYREGQTVAKGTPLIDIDPRPYQAALDTALGALARDRGVLAQAQMDLERYQAAWARNAIAKQQLDDQAKLVEQDQGLVKSDEGTVETDQVQLAFCHITSPISGRVGLRLVDPGNIVTANSTTALVVVTQVQPITVVFTISEDALPQVEAAMKRESKHGGLVTTVFDRTNEHQLTEGRLTSLDNQIDTTTGTLKLRATFANRDMALYPNQFVNTRLLTNVLQNQTMVPSSAIQRNGQQAFVYKITKDTSPAPATPNHAAKPGGANGAGKNQSADNQPSMIATMVNVKVGNTDGMMTAVQGVNAGDIVADSSFEKLQNKSRVRVVKQKIGASDEETGTP
jgi:multidrug efflux system membrane fusion protein